MYEIFSVLSIFLFVTLGIIIISMKKITKQERIKEVDNLTEQRCRYSREINYLIQCKSGLEDFFSEKTLEEVPINYVRD